MKQTRARLVDSESLARSTADRIVTATETEEGRRWAESRIKQLEGGDTVSARFMRQDFFEYRPTFELFTAGNHKPSLRSVDEAIGVLSPSGSHSSRSCRLASPIRFRSHPGPFFPSAAEVRFLALLARP